MAAQTPNKTAGEKILGGPESDWKKDEIEKNSKSNF